MTDQKKATFNEKQKETDLFRTLLRKKFREFVADPKFYITTICAILAFLIAGLYKAYENNLGNEIARLINNEGIIFDNKEYKLNLSKYMSDYLVGDGGITALSEAIKVKPSNKIGHVFEVAVQKIFSDPANQVLLANLMTESISNENIPIDQRLAISKFGVKSVLSFIDYVEDGNASSVDNQLRKNLQKKIQKLIYQEIEQINNLERSINFIRKVDSVILKNFQFVASDQLKDGNNYLQETFYFTIHRGQSVRVLANYTISYPSDGDVVKITPRDGISVIADQDRKELLNASITDVTDLVEVNEKISEIQRSKITIKAVGLRAKQVLSGEVAIIIENLDQLKTPSSIDNLADELLQEIE